MAIRHVYNQTVADGTATSVVRPSDWNSAHNQTLFLAGNTAGASSISGSDIYWAGGSNITLSANGSTVSVIGAAQTVDTNKAGTGFTSTTTAGTAITATLGTNGLSMAVPQYLTTYVNDLTSGRAGTGFTSTSTTGVLVTAALGTNGLSMAVPNYITTYVNDLTSGRAGTGTTLATTNANATLNVNTNGVALSLSVPNDDYNGWNLVGNTAGTSGSTITTQGALYFSGGNNITLSGNSNTIVISAGAGGGTTNQTGPNIAASNGTITSGTVVFANSNGVSFGLNGSTMTASVNGGGVTYSGWAPHEDYVMVAGQQGNGTVYIEPQRAPAYVQDRVAIPILYTNTSNSTGTVTLSYFVGLYTKNASTLSLSVSSSISATIGFSGTAGSYSLHSGLRLLTFPWNLTVPAGDIYIAHLSRTSTSSQNASISQMLVSQVNSNFVGFLGQSHNTTQQFTQGQGIYTATSSSLPNSIAFSQIRGSDSIAFRPPSIMFMNGTV